LETRPIKLWCCQARVSVWSRTSPRTRTCCPQAWGARRADCSLARCLLRWRLPENAHGHSRGLLRWSGRSQEDGGRLPALPARQREGPQGGAVVILVQSGSTRDQKSSSKTGPPSVTSCRLVHQLARPPGNQATGGGGWSRWTSTCPEPNSGRMFCQIKAVRIPGSEGSFPEFSWNSGEARRDSPGKLQAEIAEGPGCLAVAASGGRDRNSSGLRTTYSAGPGIG
jgi:hypothetical protein